MSERKTSCYLLILFIVSEFANSSIRCAAAAAADVLNPMMIIMLLSNIPQRQRRSRGHWNFPNRIVWIPLLLLLTGVVVGGG